MFINPIKNGYYPNSDGVKFGDRVISGKKEFHYGVDLVRNETAVVEILAAADGTVSDIWPENKTTYGNVIFIKHIVNKKTYTTVYAHLKSKSVMVKKGDKVKQGQQIGIMGNTGRSYGAHLHFELHEGAYVQGRKNAVNPEKYIKLYTKAEVQKMKTKIEELEKKIEALTLLVEEQQTLVSEVAVYKSNKPVSTYAAGSLKFATDLKLLKGDINGELNPHGVLTRQDFAVVLQRYHEDVVSQLVKSAK